MDSAPGHDRFHHGAGLLLLAANKVRHAVRGYRRPRPFPITEFDRAIDYDLGVVAGWRRRLREYLGRDYPLAGRRVLELGPGADLGVGLHLLHLGAARYDALDVHNLAASVPPTFYDRLLTRLYAAEPSRPGTPRDRPELDSAEPERTELERQLERALRGNGDRLHYVCRPDFDPSIFGEGAIDLVVSQAAFEHFDDVAAVTRNLSRAVKSGGLMVAEIDLQTHTRWIRERDPLNIYRYGDGLYNLFRFRGSPNRVRPHEYAAYLAECGWERVVIVPDRTAEAGYVAAARPGLAARFRAEKESLGYLSVYLCATRS